MDDSGPLPCCASYFGACEPGNRNPALTCNPVSACLALRRIVSRSYLAKSASAIANNPAASPARTKTFGCSNVRGATGKFGKMR